MTEKISDNKSLIVSGFLLTFFSSFGQTFLISLYAPGIMEKFSITNSLFGSIYGAATVLSAAALIYAGNLIDIWPLRRYTILSVLILAGACLTVGFAPGIAVLFLGIWGLRFAGQGLFTHITSTAISKHFNSVRGKALGVTSLGYSAGEGILPVVTGLIISLFGWRQSIMINAFFLLAVLLPLILFLMRGEECGECGESGETGKKVQEKFSRKLLFSDRRFYIIAANSFIQPFAVTGLFFYQLVLASDKGWPVELITSGFILYAAGRSVFSLVGGPLVDRYTAVKMLPWYLVPYAAALAVLYFFSSSFIALLYLVLTGISIGLSSSVKTAVLAEVFGTKNIGGVRSVYSMISVLSTAASPALFGLIIDSGAGFSPVILLSLILVLISIIISFALKN